MADTQDIFVKMALDGWNTYLIRTEKLVTALSDERLQQPVAPGRNTGAYLLGHLVAVHDGLLPLFGLGEKLFPQFEEPFLKSPDGPGARQYSITELRNAWQEVHSRLAKEFTEFSAEDWFQKHSAVSEEAFAKEPHRNRLNVLLNRTSHLSYHLGQLVFLKK